MVSLFIAAMLCAEAPSPTIEDRIAAGEQLEMHQYMHWVAMRHRRANGLADQRLDEECTSIAQNWANWMAANHNMSHGGGEQIIAMGQTTPEWAFDAWMNSSGHRFWMLSNTTRAGWGCQISSSGAYYWAGCFRSDPSPVVEGAVANAADSGTMDDQSSGRRFRLFRRR